MIIVRLDGPVVADAMTADDDVARTFLAAFAEALGRPHANTWLKDASFDRVDGEWILFATTRFNAHWIATRLRPGTAAGGSRRRLARHACSPPASGLFHSPSVGQGRPMDVSASTATIADLYTRSLSVLEVGAVSRHWR